MNHLIFCIKIAIKLFMSYFQGCQPCQPCQPQLQPCLLLACQPCQPCPPSQASPQVLEEVLPAEKVESIVKKEYIPYERKVIEYIEEEVEEKVPVVKKVVVN
jgi:hypothetical protein